MMILYFPHLHFLKKHSSVDIFILQKRRKLIIGSVHQILVLIAYALKTPLNDHVDISSGARGLNLDTRSHLHPYFVYASSESSGESHEPSVLARWTNGTINFVRFSKIHYISVFEDCFICSYYIHIKANRYVYLVVLFCHNGWKNEQNMNIVSPSIFIRSRPIKKYASLAV